MGGGGGGQKCGQERGRPSLWMELVNNASFQGSVSKSCVSQADQALRLHQSSLVPSFEMQLVLGL